MNSQDWPDHYDSAEVIVCIRASDNGTTCIYCFKEQKKQYWSSLKPFLEFLFTVTLVSAVFLLY